MGVVAHLGLARSDQPAPSNFAVLRSSTRQRLETVRKQSTSSDLDTLSTEQQQTPVLQYHRHLWALCLSTPPLHLHTVPPRELVSVSHRIASHLHRLHGLELLLAPTTPPSSFLPRPVLQPEGSVTCRSVRNRGHRHDTTRRPQPSTTHRTPIPAAAIDALEMSVDTEPMSQLVGGLLEDDRLSPMDDAPTQPATPRDDESVILASQQTIPSTEAPNSPVDPLASFQSDAHDDAVVPVIPSSLTPPPSSQFVSNAAAGAIAALGYAASQRTGIFSPPATGLHGLAREAGPVSEFTLPTLQKVTEASVEELRSMLSGCITEHAKLKMEAAHHKLQYSLLTIQADEDAKRSAVEHEMTRKEVEALRMAEHSRQARRDLTSANEASHTKYLQLKVWYDRALEENDGLHKKFKAARKVIQQKEDELAELTDERDMLLNRIRENREHFHILCSPGGMFHGAVTPKAQTATTPAQPQRATPRQTPRSAQREARTDRDHSNEKEVARLLQGLSQENNSAPSTPLPGHRPVHRAYSKHTRNVQSMSSLPTTPIARSRLGTGALLPSVDLVPQTEPPHRASRLVPQTPPAGKVPERRKSRESTISADDNEELARQALQSVAAATVSFASRVSQHARSMSRPGEEAEEEVWESQASQAASEMLRRDPRESFEVASSVNSRDGTPAPAEKSAKLQAKLFGGLKAGGEKRKLGGTGEVQEEGAVREGLSPTKKLRLAGGLRDPGRVGLGIRYGQEA